MKSAEERIQPCDLEDGDYESLLGFMTGFMDVLVPGFEPPFEMMGKDEDIRHGESQRLTYRWGDGGRGFEATHYSAPYPGDVTMDEVRVRPFGLPGGVVFELEYARRDPDDPYVLLRVQGPDEGVTEITAAFIEYFEI